MTTIILALACSAAEERSRNTARALTTYVDMDDDKARDLNESVSLVVQRLDEIDGTLNKLNDTLARIATATERIVTRMKP